VGLIAELEAATHRVVEHLQGELRPLGLTPGEVNALAQMGPTRPVSVAELQSATGQRPSTLTGVIDRLEGRGLLARAVNARDRRSFVLELTPAGQEAAARVQAAFAALEQRALEQAGPAAVAGCRQVLEALR
jgi:MarR family transcriptional regulator, organic hydroperoxide resistance regulator